MKIRYRDAVIMIVIVSLAAAISVYAQDSGKSARQSIRGAVRIIIPSAPMPSVAFPHGIHQDELKDCMLCHDLFAQKPGIISSMKAEKRLKGKVVMNTKCIACHKKRMKAGKDAGPVRCQGCHSVKPGM